MNGISPDVLQIITSLGVTGIALLWLFDVKAALAEERRNHEATRQKLYDCLKDCNREDETKRFPSTLRDMTVKPP